MSYPHFSGDCHQHHDLVVDFAGARPTITVLCGSTRFYNIFREQNLRLTLAGHIVLSIGCDTKSDTDLAAAGEFAFTSELKDTLDELHKRKIDLADEVLVVSDESGYYGDSTRAEIDYARKLGKPIGFLVHPQDGDDWRPVTGKADTAWSEEAAQASIAAAKGNAS